MFEDLMRDKNLDDVVVYDRKLDGSPLGHKSGVGGRTRMREVVAILLKEKLRACVEKKKD